ncbi:hypothetical protein DTO212C5_3772 [Paecilomyces variotii]|nr:hypothetical protein DTO212C5_3772 [Paecilomyces variotii]
MIALVAFASRPLLSAGFRRKRETALLDSALLRSQKRDSRTRCERHTTDAVTLHDASPRGHQKRLEASYQAGCETAELAPSAIGVRDHGLASSSVEHASQAWVAPKIFQLGLDELPIELLSCPVIAVCSRILSRKVGGYHRQFPSTSQCQTVKSALGSFSLSLFFFQTFSTAPAGRRDFPLRKGLDRVAHYIESRLERELSRFCSIVCLVWTESLL